MRGNYLKNIVWIYKKARLKGISQISDEEKESVNHLPDGQFSETCVKIGKQANRENRNNKGTGRINLI